MAHMTLTSFDQHSDDLTAVRTGSYRRWKVTSLILAIICFTLATVVVFMASRRSEACHRLGQSMITTTESSVVDIVTDSIDQAVTSFDQTTTDSDLTGSSNDSSPTNDTPASISDFNGYEASFGLSLSRSIYYNIHHQSEVQGFVISVTLRLFTAWEGGHPLYLFRVKTYYLEHQITYRYPLLPERNTTDWQTIDIPLREFSVAPSNFLAVGMQDSTPTNRIYGVRSTISINGRNVTSDTDAVYPKATDGFYGAAFTYTVVRNDQA